MYYKACSITTVMEQAINILKKSTGSASQFCLPYSLISPVGLRTPCDIEWAVHLTDFRKIITNKSIIQLRVRTYLLGCDKHLVKKTQPLKNKHRSLGLWDLLQGLFIQC